MPLEERSDYALEALLKRYLQGETEVSPRLLNHYPHRQRVERIARNKVKGSVVCWEDAAQEAHLKVLQAARNGRFRKVREGKARDFYAWAAVVARNAIADLIRKEQRRRKFCHNVLDLDNLEDKFDFAEALEDADLALKIPETIARIDQRYPKKAYLKLFKGLVAEKSQSQLATELGVSQGEISKRRKELNLQIWKELGFLSVKEVEAQLKEIRQGKSKRRDRTEEQW